MDSKWFDLILNGLLLPSSLQRPAPCRSPAALWTTTSRSACKAKRKFAFSSLLSGIQSVDLNEITPSALLSSNLELLKSPARVTQSIQYSNRLLTLFSINNHRAPQLLLSAPNSLPAEQPAEQWHNPTNNPPNDTDAAFERHHLRVRSSDIDILSNRSDCATSRL